MRRRKKATKTFREGGESGLSYLFEGRRSSKEKRRGGVLDIQDGGLAGNDTGRTSISEKVNDDDYKTA